MTIREQIKAAANEKFPTLDPKHPQPRYSGQPKREGFLEGAELALKLTGWQPIETVSKDKNILIKIGSACCAGRWAVDADAFHIPGIGYFNIDELKYGMEIPELPEEGK